MCSMQFVPDCGGQSPNNLPAALRGCLKGGCSPPCHSCWSRRALRMRLDWAAGGLARATRSHTCCTPPASPGSPAYCANQIAAAACVFSRQQIME